MSMMYGIGSLITTLAPAVLWGVFCLLAVPRRAKLLLVPAFATLGLTVFSLLVVGRYGYLGYGGTFLSVILALAPPALLIISLFAGKGTPCFIMCLIGGCLEAFILLVSVLSVMRFLGYGYFPGYVVFTYLASWLTNAAAMLACFGVAFGNRRKA